MILVASSLSGCATNQQNQAGGSSSASCSALGPKALTGAVAGAAGGAAIGALAGKNAKGALIGAGAGLLVGLLAGKALDSHDCELAKAALQQMSSTPTGQQIAWNNPATGNKGTLTPTGDAAPAPDGRICRPYKRDVTLKTGEQTAGDLGTTCRTANGDWEAIS
jgi:surface antigen